MSSNLPSKAHLSALWDADVRALVKNNKLPDEKLHAESSKTLVPGTVSDLKCSESPVPVMLLQKPGCRLAELSGYASGWDLLLPESWGKAFWLALIQRGARASGLREAASIDLQWFHLHFPTDYPDTEAGQEENHNCRLELSNQRERRPPAKRAYIRPDGSKVPFSENWIPLLKEWCHRECEPLNNCANFFVCRCRQSLTFLSGFCRKPIKGAFMERQKIGLLGLSPSIRQHAAMCLVPVQLRAQRRGALPAFSTIVKLTAESEQCNNCIAEVTCDKHDMSQPVIGYISHGHFALAVGEGRAIGFVALYALFSILGNQSGPIHVLVRSLTSSHYRHAFLEVLVD